jgi:hypothetical protein
LIETKRRRTALAAAALAVAALAACGGPPAQTPEQSSASSASRESQVSVAVSGEGTHRYPTAAPATSTAGRFQQTWPTSYGKTTCQQWRNVMTGHQTFVASADMLVAARATVDKNAAMPDDGLIGQFEGEITTACERSLP